jgi:hypothetical protein
MAYTQADLDRLETAIAKGVLTVTVEGRQITYRSLAELERARAIVARALSGGPAPRAIRIIPTSGLR